MESDGRRSITPTTVARFLYDQARREYDIMGSRGWNALTTDELDEFCDLAAEITPALEAFRERVFEIASEEC